MRARMTTTASAATCVERQRNRQLQRRLCLHRSSKAGAEEAPRVRVAERSSSAARLLAGVVGELHQRAHARPGDVGQARRNPPHGADGEHDKRLARVPQAHLRRRPQRPSAPSAAARTSRAATRTAWLAGGRAQAEAQTTRGGRAQMEGLPGAQAQDSPVALGARGRRSAA